MAPMVSGVTPRPAHAVPEGSLLAARVADGRLGTDTVVLAMDEILGITDAFVITSAGNARHVRTIAEEVEQRLKEAGGGSPVRIEGLDDARWVVMDYGDFLVHVFLDEARAFYDLEHLWSGAPRIPWATT